MRPSAKSLKLSQADAVDAFVATHPQIGAVILRVGQHLESDVVIEPVFGGDAGELAIFEAAQAAVDCADPQAARPVFKKRNNRVVLAARRGWSRS